MVEAQVHGHQEAVLDPHFLADRQVELVVDQRFAQVLREFQVAVYGRQRTHAEAFVGDVVAVGRAQGEGRVLVEEKSAPWSL